MIDFFYASIIIGQIVGWLVFFPRSEQLDEVYWHVCLSEEAGCWFSGK